MDKIKLKLNICGTTFTISSDDSEEYMYSIGEQVDKKIKGFLDKNPEISSLMAAELAALEYCDLLNKTDLKVENLKNKEELYLKEITELNDTIELKNLELEDMNLKIQKYEENIKQLESKINNVQIPSNEELVTESKAIDENIENESNFFTTFSMING